MSHHPLPAFIIVVGLLCATGLAAADFTATADWRDDAIVVTWPDHPQAAAYRIERIAENGAQGISQANGAQASARIPVAAPEEYRLRVVALDAEGTALAISNTVAVFARISQFGSNGDMLMYPDEAPPVPEADALRARSLVAYSGDPRIDAILSQWRWGSSTLTFSFYKPTANLTYYGTEANLKEVPEAVKANVREILSHISQIANLTFVEVEEGADGTQYGRFGRIRIMGSDDPTYAYAYYPASDEQASVSGDIHLSNAYIAKNDSNGFGKGPGSHGYTSLMHEIGHALGLKHPHDGTVRLTAEQDHFGNTVMTYNFQTAHPAHLMRYDALALRYLYGATPDVRAASTTWTLQGLSKMTDGTTLWFPSYYASSLKLLINDRGGMDTLDMRGMPTSSKGYRVDLRSEGVICQRDEFDAAMQRFDDGIAIADGSSIETILTSSSVDDIYLPSGAQTVAGYASDRANGNDVINEATLADMLDLRAFPASQRVQSRSGDDLLVSLTDAVGAGRGSVRVKNHYTSNPITLLTGATGNASPTIGAIAAQVIAEDGGTGALSFAIADAETPATQLMVTASAADATLLPASGIVLGGAGGSRTITVTPASNRHGTTAVTLMVGDGGATASATFAVTVTAVNDPPVNVAAPTVSGSAQVGSVLQGGVGLWSDAADSGSIASYAYQWQRLAPTATAPVAIAGATGLNYTPVEADAGARLRLRVQATDSGSPLPAATQVAYSDYTEAVATALTGADIGTPALAGSTTSQRAANGGEVFTVSGSGSDIWGGSDSFHFAHRQLVGDGVIVARVVSMTNTNSWAKAGIMLRQSLAANSQHAFVAATPGNGIAFQRRTASGGASSHTAGSRTAAPRWLRLERSGSTITASESADGSSWTQIGTTTWAMGDALYIGLAVTAHTQSKLCTAIFDGVRITSQVGGNG